MSASGVKVEGSCKSGAQLRVKAGSCKHQVPSVPRG
jgi:hypothetical protein